MRYEQQRTTPSRDGYETRLLAENGPVARHSDVFLVDRPSYLTSENRFQVVALFCFVLSIRAVRSIIANGEMANHLKEKKRSQYQVDASLGCRKQVSRGKCER